ncbi:MAG TPA: hypothetical protein VJB57_09930 [Dehalococcoidia bacterium]|nr:hypothetical protein [Dehalococcoidia bacterium]
MTCEEAGLREDAAFDALARAVAHRQRIDAKLAIYDEHWEGYEAALAELEPVVQAYRLALDAVRAARSRHQERV